MTLPQESLIRVHLASRPHLMASAWVVVRDFQVAEDIFQNVSIKLLSGKQTFETESQLVAWTRIAVRNEAVDWVRKNKRDSVIINTEMTEAMEQLDEEWDQAIVSERFEALRDCLSKLPASAVQLLSKRYFEEKTCSHIASDMDLGLDAVYQRLSRLHKQLKDCIDKGLAITR